MSRTALYLSLISGQRRGPLATLAKLALTLPATAYALVTGLRNKAYDLGLAKSFTAAAPVVSIGNATTGGTGKTPMVEYVARHYRSQGLMVAILSRGYGSAHEGGMNDEGLLLDQNLPDVPHLQGPDRVELARIATNELESQALILDDGHQHRRLNRDLNIVLIDATCPFGHNWLLPRGLLREPLAQALRRANLIVLTRSDMVTPAEKEKIRQKTTRLTRPGTPWVESTHKPLDLLMADGHVQPLQSILGKKVALFSGLGNPAAFRRTVEQLGAQVIAEKTFADHHQYAEADLANLSRWAAALSPDLVLTSQKDFVKLPIEHLGGRPLGALRIGLEIIAGETELTQALNKIITATAL